MRDEDWTGDARSAVLCATLLLVLLLLLDGGSGRLTAPRAALWTALAILLLVVLLPARVTARAGRLSSRGLLRERSVRTDRLVAVRWSDGVPHRLILRDTDGGRVEVDPRVLSANPQLWHQLDTGARTSSRRGTLRCGATAMRRLARRLDGESARSVFELSGLE
ncbi:hypothetical protein [Streptomyces chryseus]|uniref:hypothetical protein n=1 Tax=Streptomyces chryseus TaxID=68186 RepID=UPI00110F91BB|nr:hypothetical protein [Streptomyces chryseus]GGX23509.1 hypothetical protein GCM10010353_43180 [Streptomyces chryseus]